MKIPPFLNRMFRITKVKKQLYIIYFSALLIPILLIGIFLILNTRNLLLKHYQNQVEADNIRVKSIMFDVTMNVYNISDDLFSDKELQLLLEQRYTSVEDAYRACNNYSKITNYIKKNSFLSDIKVYTTNPTIYEYGNFMPVTSEIQDTDWYKETSTHADILWKSLETLDYWDHTSQELCLLRRIPIISTGEYAVLVIKISNNYLKNRIQNNTLFTTVSVNEDPVFYSTDRTLIGRNINLPIEYNKSHFQYSGNLTYEDKKSIANISTLLPYVSKDKLYISTLDFKALPDAAHILVICSIIIIMACIVPFLLISLFTNHFSSRINTLLCQMHKASNGDYDIIDTFKGNDELSEVFSDLKVMIHCIMEMDAEMYDAKLKEQELKNQQQKMEFKMLASQINPHFIYNTLETIRMKSFTEGNRDVAHAIKLLGKYLHYVLENTGTSSTTLKKELDYIQTYLSIQKLRFDDRVNYMLTVQDEMNLEEYQILPLLLQPIVENAILHGLEGTNENGKIFIDVQAIDDEFLKIYIFDNGLGMTKEELSVLIQNIQTRKPNKTSSIGLYNINQRIKLYYGGAYGMELRSHQNEGTLVTLTLPLHNTMEE
jgi:two-component system sensor histidine kinase YesM